MSETPIYRASAEHQIPVGEDGVKNVDVGYIVTSGGDEPNAYPPENFAAAFPDVDVSGLEERNSFDAPEPAAPEA